MIERLSYRLALVAGLLASLSLLIAATGSPQLGTRIVWDDRPVHYSDSRPATAWRLPARDEGIVLRHGQAPGGCDSLGARDVWIYRATGGYILHYDGAGPTGWLVCSATSVDLVHWRRYGSVLQLGSPASRDSASASYGTTYYDGRRWHMFYLGTPNATSAPERVPSFPYNTMKAISRGPNGPWHKQYSVVPFALKAGSYYASTGSPGPIIRDPNGYRMVFSAATFPPVKRTLAFARTRDLNGAWTVAPMPILPGSEQIENASFYYQESNKTWFLFTNHVGIAPHGTEYTDAIWVYWTQDLHTWNSSNKAVVLDDRNVRWSPTIIGIPSVIRVGSRLAILYDGRSGVGVPGDNEQSAEEQKNDQVPQRRQARAHVNRDIGLAWLDLPLRLPQHNKAPSPRP